MRKGIKSIVILASLIMTFAVTISVNAASDNPYQAVIDKLNEEYSMNIHFMPSAEKGRNSISNQGEINVTPEEFEANLREAIIENNRAKAEADKKFKELETKDIDESGSGICSSTGTLATRTTSNVKRSKNVAGATVYLEATVSNDPGYWKYNSINNVYTTYLVNVNSKPPFFANTYNYSLIDARRTCALKLYGYTADYGVMIDENAYRYVEFWAGSGM